MTAPTRPRRRFLRWVLYILLALLALLLLAAGCGAWWLWGWRLGSLSFHESWSAPQRAELLALADDLRGFQRSIVDHRRRHASDGTYAHLVMHDDGSVSWGTSSLSPWEEEYVAAMSAKFVAAPLMDSLKRMTAKGQDAVSPQEAGLLAQAAIRTLRPQLAAELIRRGADVNAKHVFKNPFDEELEGESTFQYAITGNAYFSEASIPLAERLALLDLMLEHGADVTYKKAYSLLSAYISAAAKDAPDHGAALEWLLSHGLTIESPDEVENAAMTLACQGTLPAFKRLAQKGLLPLTPENKARLLRRCLATPDAESEAKALWLLEELGADPTFTLFYSYEDQDDEGNPVIQQKQNAPIIESITRYLPIYKTEEECRYALRLLNLLLAHGAHLPENAADTAPTFPALRDAYMELISKHTRH